MRKMRDRKNKWGILVICAMIFSCAVSGLCIENEVMAWEDCSMMDSAAKDSCLTRNHDEIFTDIFNKLRREKCKGTKGQDRTDCINAVKKEADDMAWMEALKKTKPNVTELVKDGGDNKPDDNKPDDNKPNDDDENNSEEEDGNTTLTEPGYTGKDVYTDDDKTTMKTNIFGDVKVKDGDGIFVILAVVINVLTFGVGAAATIGIVISGIQYMSARDDANQIAKAKMRILQVVIGLVVYAMMWGVVQWLLPGGVLNTSGS